MSQRALDERRRMRLADLDPQLRPAFRWFARLPVRRAWQRRLVQAAIGRIPTPKPAGGVRFERVDFDTDGTGVRVFTPAGGGDGGALLWIHGGGFVIGGAAIDDRFCAEVAAELGTVVVSAEYRLAPEHPFPAPLDDCMAAWDWLRDAASARGIDEDRIAVGGESAGGSLAAALAQRLLDDGGAQPCAQLLFCPMLDDRTAARRELDAIRHLTWDNRDNRVGWTAYLDGRPGAGSPPPGAVPARRSDLRGLPPAWIGVGDIDLFHDEDVAYANALTAAGVDCTLDVVAGAPHGFETVARATPVARAFHARARAWLAGRLAVR
ncbi:alpha/beta hydrolase [Agromyces arachidis]|uniref:alpha/beta hydrolase n=1 Tax=Agromyces arachidis TaxID=766966 RepID=UPI0040574C26